MRTNLLTKISAQTNWYKAIAILLFAVLSSLPFTSKTYASHAMGADLTYECLGGNVYVFTLSFYRDCSGITAPASATINISSASCGVTTSLTLTQPNPPVEISPLCASALSTCQGGTEPGVEQYTYTDTMTLPQNCPDWVFSWSLCCRNPLTTNLVAPSSQTFYVESTLDNTGGICNTSPIFTNLPVAFICENQLINYNFGTIDADGDSLVYSLVNALSGTPPAGNLTYVAPYSPTYPITTDSGYVDFDPLSGSLSLTPDTTQVSVVVVLVEEYRNGVLIGSVMRDIQVLVLSCSANTQPYMSSGGIINLTGNGVLLDSNSVDVCVGNSIFFDINFSDNDATDTLTVTTNLAVAIPGALFDTTGINPVTGSFSWTPTINDLGLNPFTITVKDDACPVVGLQTYVFDIRVLKGVYAGPDIFHCDTDSVQLNVIGGINYVWTPSTGLSDTSIANPMALPDTTTTYIVTSDSTGACIYQDTITIFIVPDFALTTSPDTTICIGGATQISALASPPDTYVYSWSPATGLDDDTIFNPTANPAITTVYYVDVISSSGCLKTGSVTVSVDTTTLSVNPTAGNLLICAGDSTALYANVTGIPPYTITWEDDLGNIIDTTENIIVSPDTPTTYSVIITNAVCVDTKTIDIDVSSVNAGTDTTICNGGSIQLNAVYDGPTGSILPDSCGLSVGCNGTGGIIDYTVGTGLSTNTSTTYPAPYGNWYKNAKHQILYTAADLLAAGVTPGTINALGFNIAVINGTTTYNAFEIKIGCTSLSSLSTWEPGLQTVFTPKTVNITTGWNIHTLDSPYDWDGTSNIIIELCYDNLSSAYTNNSSTYYTTTGYTSVLYYRSDATLACPFTGSQTISSNRPNTLFTVCTDSIVPTYSWSPTTGLSNDTIPNPVASVTTTTTYTVTVDIGICSTTDEITITASTPMTLSITSTDATCGNADGGAFVVTSNGVAPYTYLWDDSLAQTTDTATGLAAGAYTVLVTDANGCTATGTVAVNNVGAPSISGITTTVIECYGDSSTATVSVSGGTPPYNYLWNDPLAQTDSIATGLLAGSYTVAVTDINGCIATGIVSISQPPILSVSVSGNNVSCNGVCDGDVTVSITGGTPPYSYLWDDPLAQTTATADSLCAGTYTVTITDANGCVVNDGITITQPAVLTTSITGSTNVSSCGVCDGDATVTATGGSVPYIYLWDDPIAQTTAIASGLCAGIYSVTVTDQNGCISTSSNTITDPGGLSSSITSSTDVSCNGGCDGDAKVTITGGTAPYTYLWDDSLAQTTVIADSLCAGTYSVTITDFNSCITTSTATITGPPVLTSSISGSTNMSCNGVCDGEATVTVTGGTTPYTYLWDDSLAQTAAIADSLCAGTYNVTLTDSNGCITTSIATITEPAVLTSSISGSTNLNCNGVCDGNATVSVTGGIIPYTYLWDDSLAQTTAIADSLCASTYSVTVTDSNGCITTSSGVTLNEPPAITAAPLSSTPDTNGTGVGSATISTVSGGSPPYNYNWTPSGDTGSTAIGLIVGTYTVTVTDVNGCPYVDSVSVGNFTGVFETALDIKFDVYPNPTEGLITFDIELSGTVDIEIQIRSILGELLYKRSLGEIHKTRYDHNFRDLPNGVYFIKLVTPENTVNKRIVITR